MFTDQSIKTISFLKIKEKVLIFSVLAIFVVYLPTVIHFQPLTGSLVNMSLILAVFLIGLSEAILLGLMPSVFALVSGLLPLSLSPMVPFIIVGNSILIGIYHYIGRRHFNFAVVAAGFTKFLFLFAAAKLLISLLPGGKQMVTLISMMSWIQFLTAISGGMLAYIILLFVKKIKNNR